MNGDSNSSNGEWPPLLHVQVFSSLWEVVATCDSWTFGAASSTKSPQEGPELEMGECVSSSESIK
jgi:hypothetical protein